MDMKTKEKIMAKRISAMKLAKKVMDIVFMTIRAIRSFRPIKGKGQAVSINYFKGQIPLI